MVIFQMTLRKTQGNNYSTLLPHQLKNALLQWAAKLYREKVLLAQPERGEHIGS